MPGEDLEKLGIESYGTSVTNLEEVFMRVAKISREKRQSSKEEIDLAAEVTIQVVTPHGVPSARARATSDDAYCAAVGMVQYMI